MLNPDNLDYLKTIINEITKIPMDDLDVYASNSDRTTYSKRILGDATGEMGPFYSSGSYYNNWYNDYSRFVESSNQWFTRGGGYNYGSGADQFLFADTLVLLAATTVLASFCYDKLCNGLLYRTGI